MVTNSSSYMKEYYHKNKETYRQKYNKDYFCDVCNCTMKMKHRSRHLKTMKHAHYAEKVHNTEGQVLNNVKQQIKELLAAVQCLEAKIAS